MVWMCALTPELSHRTSDMSKEKPQGTTLTAIPVGSSELVRRLRLSIQPTYDHRKTGDRYSVSSWVGDICVAKRVPIRDPFVRHTVNVHWWDALKCILFKGRVSVRVSVDGDKDIVDDVMELDSDYLLHGSTRRAEFNASIQEALAAIKDTDEDEHDRPKVS